MKHNWIYKKLTDVCGIQYGFPFDSHCFTDDSSFPPLIRIRDVMRGFSETFYNGDVPEDYYVKAGEYLIGMDGEFNIAPWRSEKALLNQRVCKIYSLDANTSIHFIYYSLIKLLKQIEAETPSVTVKHLSAKRLNQIELPIPSLDEQQAIVRELDGINRLIDLQEEQLREYDRLAQSLFYTTFGDPVSNPKGWEVKKLGEVATSELGKTLNQSKDTGVLRPYLCAINILWGEINIKTLKEARFGDSEVERYSVRKGDLLVCEGGETGRAAIWKDDEPMLYQNALHRVRFENSIVNTYALFWLQMLKQKGEIDAKYSKGVTIKHLVKSALLSIPIMCPPLVLQQTFASQVEAIEAQKALIRKSLEDTRTLLAARMQYYFE